ncbi:MAG: alpha-hydroxy-acid oxidizing protein [Desulfobacterales bacterium]|nr:alpha-hydroxy-acid oxidizing protein [Desulfobacterales bacterium]
MGASAVGVGRPIIWGLAVNGEKGAGEVLKILRKEFELAMRLSGCSSLADITPDILFLGQNKEH